MHQMRTTINLDEDLVEQARRVTGMAERTALIHEGLRALLVGFAGCTCGEPRGGNGFPGRPQADGPRLRLHRCPPACFRRTEQGCRSVDDGQETSGGRAETEAGKLIRGP